MRYELTLAIRPIRRWQAEHLMRQVTPHAAMVPAPGGKRLGWRWRDLAAGGGTLVGMALIALPDRDATGISTAHDLLHADLQTLVDDLTQQIGTVIGKDGAIQEILLKFGPSYRRRRSGAACRNRQD